MSDSPPDHWDEEYPPPEKGSGPPLPHDEAAEKRLIGTMLLGTRGENDRNGFVAYLDAVDRQEIRELRSGDFYDQRHAFIWNAIVDVAKKKDEYAVDPVTVARNLRGGTPEEGEKSLLAAAGGPEYLAYLAALGEDSTIRVPIYVQMVHQCADLRRMARVLGQNHEAVFRAGDKSAVEIISKAESDIFALGEEIRGGVKKKEISEIVGDVVQRLADATQSGNYSALDGVATGFEPFDELLSGGFRPGELVILAARTSLGKTALALDVASRLAAKQKPVLFLSLEMSGEQIAVRLLAREAQVNTILTTRGRMGTAKLQPDELTRMAAAAAEMRTWPLGVEDEKIDDLDKVLAKIRGAHRRFASDGKKLGLVIVDYLQLVELPVHPGSRRDLRAVEVGQVSRSLKTIARELGIPILALAQLNRRVENRESPRPGLADLRDSGAIEQDADSVLFLYSEKTPEKDDNYAYVPEESVFLANAKARQGIAGGKVEIKFIKAVATFAKI